MEFIYKMTDRILKNPFRIFLSILLTLLLTKIIYIFAFDFWRLDLFYYIQSVKVLNNGGQFYKDFFIIRPPGMYLIIYMLGKTFSNFDIFVVCKIFSLIVQLFTALILFKLAESLCKNRRKALWLTLFFLICISLHFDLWPFKIMLFSLLPVFAALYFLTRKDFKPSSLDLIISGFFTGILAVFATGLALYALLYPLWLYYYNRNFKKTLIQCLLAALGFLIPVGLTLFFIYKAGAFKEFYYQAFVWAPFYASHYPLWLKIWKIFYNFLMTWQLMPLYILAVLSVITIFKEKIYKINKASVFCLFVFIPAILNRLALSRGAVRYQFFLIPAFILILLFLDKKRILKHAKYLLPLLAVGFAFTFFYQSWHFAAKKQQEINERTKAYEWIKNNTSKSDRIYVWPEGYEVYIKTKRVMTTRFFSAKEQLDNPYMWSRGGGKFFKNHLEQFISQLKAKLPKLFVLYYGSFKAHKGVKKRPAELQKYMDRLVSFIKENYEIAYFSKKKDGIVIWKLKAVKQ